MTAKTPVRVVFDSSNVATGLGEFQTGETVPLTHGGTGAALTIGSAGQVMRVNASGTAIEFADQGDIDTLFSADSTGVQVTDNLNVSGTLRVDTIDTNTISPNDSSGGFINDDLHVEGSITAEGYTAVVVNDRVAVTASLTEDADAVRESRHQVIQVKAYE